MCQRGVTESADTHKGITIHKSAQTKPHKSPTHTATTRWRAAVT
jgi:hypothetical protein